MNQPSKTPAQSFAELRARLQDPEFLAGHGLGNEVPFFILPYAAAQEDEVRAQTASLVEDFPAEQADARAHAGAGAAAAAEQDDAAAGAATAAERADASNDAAVHAHASAATGSATRVVHFDLWDVFLQICTERRILEKIPALEERRGTEGLLRRMEKIATPEAFLKVMSERYEQLGGQTPGRDVVLVSGVGKVYPLVRAHNILENAQPVFTEVPMVMLYPGVYDGQQLHLFGKISDGNYYRAFSLI